MKQVELLLNDNSLLYFDRSMILKESSGIPQCKKVDWFIEEEIHTMGKSCSSF